LRIVECESLTTISVAPPATAPSMAAFTSASSSRRPAAASRPVADALLPVDYRRRAFHVAGHEDLHPRSPAFRVRLVSPLISGGWGPARTLRKA
jgi:hypothetical protein